MSHCVCPWWLGYLLLVPFRRFRQNPAKILAPLIREGMTILEPGCGMGFWTLDAARLVGPKGRVIAVDLQPRMLSALKRRGEKAKLMDRIVVRDCTSESLCAEDLEGTVDLVLALFMVHEVPDARAFLQQAFRTLKPGGQMLLAEPIAHVTATEFEKETTLACDVGFKVAGSIPFPSSHAALLTKGID